MKKSVKTLCICLAVLALSVVAFGGCGKTSSSSGSSGTSFFPSVGM
jgi:hypothetical protein